MDVMKIKVEEMKNLSELTREEIERNWLDVTLTLAEEKFLSGFNRLAQSANEMTNTPSFDKSINKLIRFIQENISNPALGNIQVPIQVATDPETGLNCGIIINFKKNGKTLGGLASLPKHDRSSAA